MEWQDPHEFAKHLKRAATPAGFLMWQLLRNRQRCGAKFRREYVKEPYILDFYCPEAKLCIECDGLPHLTPEGIAKDRKRTAWLNAQKSRLLAVGLTQKRLRLVEVTSLIQSAGWSGTARTSISSPCRRRFQKLMFLHLSHSYFPPCGLIDGSSLRTSTESPLRRLKHGCHRWYTAIHVS